MKVIYESVPPAPDAAPVEENEKLQKVVMTEKSWKEFCDTKFAGFSPGWGVTVS